jgi:hypothetical protein
MPIDPIVAAASLDAERITDARTEGYDEATADIVRYLKRISARCDGQAERVLDACIEAIEGGLDEEGR